MGTFASKALIMGILAALGGLGPRAMPTPETTPEAGSEAAEVLQVADEASAEHGSSVAAHERRDAIRALNVSSRAAREAAREGGLTREEKQSLRALRMARRDAIHALNAARRAAQNDDLDSASEHGRGRGPSRGHMTHGR